MDQKKQILNMTVRANTTLGPLYSLLRLSPADGSTLQRLYPGQFVQVEVEDSKTTYLRRPISVCFADYNANELWLLVRKAGEGTRHLCNVAEGKTISVILPLGRGFSIPPEHDNKRKRLLLVGGGVGVAPLLYLGSELHKAGFAPDFLLGARSSSDLLLVDEFEKYGNVHVSTEDGSKGQRGLVTQNDVFRSDYDIIYCCGPMPMMQAVAKIAAEKQTICEVSLENKMACGLGACLCCVEKKKDGHNVCVCTEGPVFNSNELPW